MVFRRAAVAMLLVLCWTSAGASQSADPAARSKVAAQAMNEGRYEEAAAVYRELLKSLPDNPGLLTNLGMALAMSGRESEAIVPLERAVALKPDLLPARLFLGSSYLAVGQPEKAIQPLERVVAGEPADIENRRMLAQAYAAAGRRADAVAQLRRVTELAPRLPAAWHALGHAYNALAQDAMGTFQEEPEDSPWRRLLLADAQLADGRLTDAFANYRSVLDDLPSMVTVHDSIAKVYEQSGHADWAAAERAKGAMPASVCIKRKALCEFRGGRHHGALSAALNRADPESRYWRIRAATELALAAFKRLDQLPDSRERREVRAALARNERRYADAIAELEVALTFAPGDPGLLDDLGTSYYLARDYERAVATLAPLLEQGPDDARLLTIYGDSLAQLQRFDEAVPILQRAAAAAPSDPMPRQMLGRAYIQNGNYAEAIPLLESLLPHDHDGSLHVQLSRAYASAGQKEKAESLLERARMIQQQAQKRADAVARRAITPPK